MTLTPERKKQVFAGLLLVFLAIVIIRTFFSGSDDEPPRTATKSAATTPTPKPGATPPSAVKPKGKEEPLITSPLELAALIKTPQTGSTGRNIFVYPPPPPAPTPIVTPTPPPPLPPPITLSGLNPSGVIARTADFTLTLSGAKMPLDAVAFVNGRNYKTTFVNESQIKVAVPASAILAPGTLNVEVRSASNAQLYSNPIPLTITAPPPPPYRYLGFILKNGVHTGVLKSEFDEEPLNIRKGDVVGGHWRIINITDQQVEILDTNINVRHTINYTGDNG